MALSLRADKGDGWGVEPGPIVLHRKGVLSKGFSSSRN